MKIIWIDGTFGIGKSAVAAAIVEEIPQAHLLEFDALQEKYKAGRYKVKTASGQKDCV